jgi:alcohol dehydrogenase class IV
MHCGYIFGSPSTVLYGTGCLENVGERLKGYRLNKPLIVTDDTLVRLGKADSLRNIFASSQIDSCVYSGVNTEPTDIHVSEGVAALRHNNCEVGIRFTHPAPTACGLPSAVLRSG